MAAEGYFHLHPTCKQGRKVNPNLPDPTVKDKLLSSWTGSNVQVVFDDIGQQRRNRIDVEQCALLLFGVRI
ncbi:hypothetical protein SAMN05660330_00138 [Desulforhopalus singaporensis]|uniref:Uncharacterized protein n=1 Tax=Desulforhopalus singaporensis TaxID=91360 RepID=A0A1H0J3T0_9BACT|nr:hypothetical protein SAMN05660330_00138 [Desulforhopalus singaporensis]